MAPRIGRKKEAITAAAQRVDLGNRRAVKNILNYRQKWQEQAIDDTRAIGELQYGVSILAALASRIIIFAAHNPDQLDSRPVQLKGANDEEKFVMATVDRLGTSLARSDLQHDLAYNLLVTGEAYLICFGERGNIPERWEIRSIKEVDRSGDTVKTYDTLTEETIDLVPSRDTFIRIWRPDPFEHKHAISHLRAVLGAAEELLWWDAAAQAIAKNRLALSGMIGVPQSFDVRATTEEEAKMSGSERFIAQFLRSVIQAIQNPTDASAAVPVLYSYADNEQKKSGLDVHEFDRPQDALLESRTDRAITRIENGINLPAGVISGLGHATHWGAGQIEESTFRDHVEPLVLLMVSALSRAFLFPILSDDQSPVKDPLNYFVWYDASALIIHQDKSANALRALELGGISWTALRRELGLPESDAPTDEERAKILEWLSSVRGGQKQGAVPNPTQVAPVPEDPSAPPAKTAPGKRASEKEHAGPMNGKGQAPVSASVTDIHTVQLQMLCDERCRRALEIAGNRLRNRASKVPTYKAAVRNVPAMEVASTLGREAVIKLGINDLFDDAFLDLHSRIVQILPTDFMAFDTIRPINELVTELRTFCAEALFKPPTQRFLVPNSLIDDFFENLSMPPMAS